MSIPKLDKHKAWKKLQRKKVVKEKCQKQFPDCPENPSIELKCCRLCPFSWSLVSSSQGRKK